jgi:HK97 family phage prohead protease
LFVDTSFRTIDISKEKGIKAIIGKLKTEPQGSTVIQSYLFLKDKWTVSTAQDWVNEHGKSADEWLFDDNKEINFKDNEEDKRVEKIIKQLDNVIVKDFNDEERSFTGIASTETIDRDGDIIRANGWKLGNFKKNPVFMWAHDYRQPPIGKITDINIDNDKLRYKVTFPEKGTYVFADTIYDLYKQGFIRAVSVGFNPIKWQDREADNEKGGISMRGREFTSQELLEISGVPIPSNYQALADKNYNTIVSKTIAGNWGEEINKTIPPVEEPAKPEESKLTEKILSDDIILPLKLDDKMIEYLKILKSGRVISEKNKSVIKSAIEEMTKTIDILNSLLVIDNKPEAEEEQGGEKTVRII